MIRLGLDSISYLCEKLNNPQDKLRFIHIAGTNGKGSTGAYIASILKEAGYRVGHFSSPAVFSREEIIKVNNRNISKKDYDEGMAMIDGLCKEIQDEGHPVPTEFERQTALCFWYYVNRKCDIVVLECGMGGRTDATNIVSNTLVSVFTAISLDHTDYLGKTISEITSVKAGIIKPGAAVVSAPCSDEVLKELTKEASQYGTDVKIAEVIKFKRGVLGMKGSKQPQNASLAIEAVKALPRNVFKITDKNIENGLHNARLSGRFELIKENPNIIIDGGHNPDAAQNLYDSLMMTYPDRRIIFIVGMLCNKDHKKYLETIMPIASALFTVSTDSDRGYSAQELANDALEAAPDPKVVTSIGGVEEAIDIARMMADKKDVIVISGSFTILAKAVKYICR